MQRATATAQMRLTTKYRKSSDVQALHGICGIFIACLTAGAVADIFRRTSSVSGEAIEKVLGDPSPFSKRGLAGDGAEPRLSAFLFAAQLVALLFLFAPSACKEKVDKRLYVTPPR